VISFFLLSFLFSAGTIWDRFSYQFPLREASSQIRKRETATLFCNPRPLLTRIFFFGKDVGERDVEKHPNPPKPQPSSVETSPLWPPDFRFPLQDVQQPVHTFSDPSNRVCWSPVPRDRGPFSPVLPPHGFFPRRQFFITLGWGGLFS